MPEALNGIQFLHTSLGRDGGVGCSLFRVTINSDLTKSVSGGLLKDVGMAGKERIGRADSGCHASDTQVSQCVIGHIGRSANKGIVVSGGRIGSIGGPLLTIGGFPVITLFRLRTGVEDVA